MEEGGGAPLTSRHRAAVLAVAGGLAAAVYAWPLPGIPESGRRMTSILLVVVTLWLSEALPISVTALLGPALAVLVGAASATQAFAAFGNPILMLFIGSFLLAGVTFKYRLNERIAYRVLSIPAIGSDPTRAFVVLAMTTAALSAWMSNVAVTAMMLPIAQSVLVAIAGERQGAAAHAGGGVRAHRHLLGVGRRAVHASRHAAQPDRYRPHPAGDRPPHRLRRVGGRGVSGHLHRPGGDDRSTSSGCSARKPPR